MPIKSRKPNLFRDEVDYLTDDPFVREIDKRFGKRKKEDTPEIEDDSWEITKGFAAGVDQTQALAGGAYAALGSQFGQEEWVQDGLKYYQEQMDEASEYSPAVTWEDDKEGFSDYADWLAYTVGNVAPSLITTIGTGGIGGAVAIGGSKLAVKSAINKRVKKKFEDAAKEVAEAQTERLAKNKYRDTVLRRYGKTASEALQASRAKASRRGGLAGGFLASSTLGSGENFTRILEETGLEDPGAALSLGLAMGVMDVVGAPFRALDRMFPKSADAPVGTIQKWKDNLKSFLAEKAITDGGRVTRMFNAVANPRGRITSGVKELGIGAVREGFTEATQEWLSRTSVLWAKENLTEDEQERFVDYLSSEDAMSSYLHAGVVGIIGGSVAGGTLGAVAGPKKEKFDISEAQQLQEVHAAQREVAAEEYDKGPEPQAAEPQPEVTRESLLQSVLEEVSNKNDIRVEEISANTGIDIAQTQEILDTLEEQEFIFSDIDQDGSIYNINDDADIPATVDQQEQVVTEPEPDPEPEPEPEPEIPMAAEETATDPTPFVDARGRVEPTITPAPEEAVPTEPVVEETGYGSETNVTFPATGNTYRINQYARDAGGGGFYTYVDGKPVDLAYTIEDSVKALGEIDSGAVSVPQEQVAEEPTMRVTDPTAKPTDKRDPDYDFNGEVILTFPDGDVRRIYQDIDTKVWYDTEEQNNIYDSGIDVDGEPAKTKKNAIAGIIEKRQREFDESLENFDDGAETTTATPSEPTQRRNPDNENQFIIDFPDSGGSYIIEQQGDGDQAAWFNAQEGNRLGETRQEAIDQLKTVERLSAQSNQILEITDPPVKTTLSGERASARALGSGRRTNLPVIDKADNVDDNYNKAQGDVAGTDGPSIKQRIASLNEKRGQTVQQKEGEDTIEVEGIGGNAKIFTHLTGKQKREGRPFTGDAQWAPVQVRPVAETLIEKYGMTGSDLDNAPQEIQEYVHAVLELIERGFPSNWLFGSSGVYVRERDRFGAAYAIEEKAFLVNDFLLENAVGNDALRRKLVHALAHEGMHYADFTNGYTDKHQTSKIENGSIVYNYGTSLEAFKVESSKLSEVGIDGDPIRIEMGEVTTELYSLWANGDTEIGAQFSYPLNSAYDRLMDAHQARDLQQIDNAETFIRTEMFAQLGAVYFDNPRALKQKAPKAYAMMRSIVLNPNMTSEEVLYDRSIIKEDQQTDDRRVQEDVRTPTVTRSGEIPDTGGVGSGGERGNRLRQSGGGVVGTTQREDGLPDRSTLQERPESLEITDQQRYLYQKSKGNVRGKFAVTKLLNENNSEEQLPQLEELVSRHPNVLEKGSAYLAFERDLTGTNETLRPPYALIELFNNMDQWVETHGRLSDAQIVAAREGLDTARELGDLYESGVATPRITSKLMLWGMMSRMLTASSQEAGFVDLLTSMKGENANRTEQFIEQALSGSFTDQDVADWREFVPTAIKEGSFGRAGTSNANDFGSFLKKMSERDSDGVVKLQKLHDLIADRSIPSSEVRRQFLGMTSDPGIGNKVFSFLLLMSGRDDVVVLDRIQLNTMWDSGRYGKLIYDDIAMNFEGQHGLARYEVLENALKQKIGELYERLGRGDEGSVGRYHWESWVLNSGQVVAHPTMRGLVADAKGEQAPYAFLGAPEGRQNAYRYGAIYARDADGEQYIMYPDSEGTPYKFSPKQFGSFINEIKKRGTGIVPKDFKVSDYNKGFPWYEAEGVDRQKLDEQIRAYAEREASEREYGVKETAEVEDVSDGSRQRVETPSTLEIEDPQPKTPKSRRTTIPLESGSAPGQSFNLTDEVILEARLSNKLSEKFSQKFVDRYERWRTAENAMAKALGVNRLPAEMSFRDSENLMHSRVSEQLDQFENKWVNSIAELANRYGLSPDQIGMYLLAKHAPERNASVLQKEVERREAKIAALEKQLEDSVSDTMPEGSPSIARRIEATNNEPLRHIEMGSGMTDEQAAKVLANAETAGNKAQYEEISTLVYQMLNEMRQNMVNKGLLDEQTRRDWESSYQFYVPLKGFQSIDGTYTASPRAKGFNIKGSESMKARGRITLPDNPLLNAFKDAEEKILRAEKNFAAQKLLRLVQKFEADGEWEVWTNRNRPKKRYDRPEEMSLDDMKRATRDDDGMPKYIQVKRGGQTYFIEIKDAMLNRQLQDGNPAAVNQAEETMAWLFTNLRKFQNLRRNMIINWNPSWFFVNPLRDIETGLAYLLSEQTTEEGRVSGEKLIGKVFDGWLPSGKAFYDFKRGKDPKDPAQAERFQYIREFIEDGAPTGLATTKSLEEIQRQFEKSMQGESSFRNRRDFALDWVEHVNQSAENAVRISTYIEARKAGTPRLDAATLAKDMTVNFNRKGESSSFIDSLYLFFNAAVQGNINIVDAIRRGGKAGKAGAAIATATAARKLAMGLMAWGFARTLGNLWLADEDDDGESKYNDFSPYKLGSNMSFVIGDIAGGPPLPYGWGWFDNVGRILAEQVTGTRTVSEGVVALYSQTAHHFAPRQLHAVSDDADAVQAVFEGSIGFAPDVLAFPAEQLANVNFFGSPIVLPTPYTDAPASSTGKRSTLEGFKWFAKTVNEMTGGSEYTKGGIDISPDRLQATFDFMLGGLGRFGTDAIDTAQKTFVPESELKSGDVPILRSFLYNPSEYSDQFTYYDNRADLKRERELWDNSNQATREKLIGKKSKVFYTQLVAQLKQADKRLRSNRKEIRRLQGITGGDRSRIARKIREIEDENQLIYDVFNKRYKAAKG